VTGWRTAQLVLWMCWGLTWAALARGEPGPESHSPFSTHRANYLILGPEDSDQTGSVTTKFQLSLRYDTGANWYFAYTQRSIWDVTRDSEPALDHNFEPEIFYWWRPPDGVFGASSVRAGFVHESNGRGGAESRAWNRAFVEPLWRRGGWFFEPRLWVITGTDDTNDDISDYLGYADVVIGYEAPGQQRWSFTGRQGIHHGSVRLDVSMPLQVLVPASRMRPALYAQAWAGYGETLLLYNRSTRAIRIGIEFRP